MESNDLMVSRLDGEILENILGWPQLSWQSIGLWVQGSMSSNLSGHPKVFSCLPSSVEERSLDKRQVGSSTLSASTKFFSPQLSWQSARLRFWMAQVRLLPVGPVLCNATQAQLSPLTEFADIERCALYQFYRSVVQWQVACFGSRNASVRFTPLRPVCGRLAQRLMQRFAKPSFRKRWTGSTPVPSAKSPESWQVAHERQPNRATLERKVLA